MRDVAIELRKYGGTRSGRTVLLVIAGLTLLLAGVGAVATGGSALSVSRAWSYPTAVLEVGLPVVVVLLFTSEWSSRDAVQTFLLRPHRAAVLRSKCLAGAVLIAAGLVLGLLATVLALGLRAVLTSTPLSLAGLAGGDGAVLRTVLTSGLYGVFAAGVGLLTARTAVGLVVYLGTVTLLETLLAVGLGDRSVWLSLSQAVVRLSGPDLHGSDVPSLMTSLGLWVVVPALVGGAAFLRREAR